MVHYFDVVLAVLIIGSGLWSAYRGLVREAFALLALVAGVVVATAGYGLALPWLVRWLGTGVAAKVTAFVLLFLLVVLGVTLAGRVLQKVLKIMLLGWLDRAGGFIAGVAKAVLIIGLVLLLADRFAAVHDALYGHSDLAPRLLAAGRGAFRLASLAFSRFAADFS